MKKSGKCFENVLKNILKPSMSSTVTRNPLLRLKIKGASIFKHSIKSRLVPHKLWRGPFDFFSAFASNKNMVQCGTRTHVFFILRPRHQALEIQSWKTKIKNKDPRFGLGACISSQFNIGS